MKIDFKNIFISLLAFAVGLGIGGYYLNSTQIFELKETNIAPFVEAWQKIEDNFYFSGEDEDSEEKLIERREKMLQGAIKGLIESLDDPYSTFLNIDETLEFEENLTGTYEGIGAEIGIRDEVLTVISPLKDSPAEAAGLLSGDKILEVDGESTKEISLTQAVMKIRGEEGAEVNLKVKREDEELNVVIKRARIDIPALDFETLEGNIAYIQLYNFYEDATSEFKKISQEVLNSGTKKMILDLRSNPGGYLSSSVEIGSFFVEEGEVIVQEDLHSGEIRTLVSEGPGAFSDFDVVILINNGSASASEILAGAVKENNPQVKLIGEKTFGKGSVQEFIYLEDGSSMKLTVAHWLLPSGKWIEGEGISPDIEVEMTEEDFNSNKDPQLEKAIEEIKNFVSESE